MSKRPIKFTTIGASQNLIEAMEQAIYNMTEELKKPVDPELNGSARKAELAALKETALACKELIIERQRLEQLVADLKNTDIIAEHSDFAGGFAERYRK